MGGIKWLFVFWVAIFLASCSSSASLADRDSPEMREKGALSTPSLCTGPNDPRCR